MKCQAAIAMTTRDAPKIKPTESGAEICFDLYDVSLDELRSYTGKELTLTLEVK